MRPSRRVMNAPSVFRGFPGPGGSSGIMATPGSGRLAPAEIIPMTASKASLSICPPLHCKTDLYKLSTVLLSCETTFPEVVNMKKLAIRSILFHALAAVALLGQDTTGAIFGAVSDPSGASVTGAEVKIVNSQTGF